MSVAQSVINFTKWRFVAMALSCILIIASLGSLVIKGINWGLDFTGGTLIELYYDQPVAIDDIRIQLEQLQQPDAIVQEFGSDRDVLIRIASEDVSLGNSLAGKLSDAYDTEVIIKRVEFVGPQVGERLREQGGLGMLIALGVVMAYVAFRFQFKFSVGAVTALAHDSIIVLGVFSLFELQFDLTVLAAILAIIGYSLNDTIIVYDRIRENFRLLHKAEPVQIINISLTQTLGRTLATSGTTMIVLLSLFFFGGDMIHNFSSALLMGIGIGTYSSIYIASSLLIYMKINRSDLIAPPPEEDPRKQLMP